MNQAKASADSQTAALMRAKAGLESQASLVKQKETMLQEAPVHIDDLIVRSHLPSGQLSSLLLELELSGFVQQLPGKRFAKMNV